MPVEWGKFFKNVDFFIIQTDIISNQIQEKILYNFSIKVSNFFVVQMHFWSEEEGKVVR